MSNTRSKIKFNDFNRILVSETSPYDVPLIFGNNWFYHNMNSKSKQHKYVKDTIEHLFEKKSLKDYTIPMRYRIRKDDNAYRYMGLLHPASQLNIVEFYKTYNKQIIHYCTKSEFSLRKPEKIASSYYVKNKFDNIKKYKVDGAERVSDEHKFKHSTSFFAYNSCSKLHQFFESELFLKLEGKYTEFWSLDVSKCFQSIYTHSIEWATKSKAEAKGNKSKDSFATIFDKLMQTSNYNETNGVVIGNEASRIFAEVILQKVDEEVSCKLKEMNVIYEKDYEIKRYVDDYFIFSSTPEIAKLVSSVIEEQLRFYKMHLNQSKTTKSQRPFITNITKAKIEVSLAIDELVEILFERDEKSILYVNKRGVRKKHSVIKSFLNKVQSACFQDLNSYKVMTGYVISALLNKCKEIVEVEGNEFDDDSYILYRDVFSIILEISFQLFSINISYANSIKLSMICYISFVFFDKSYPLENKTIKLEINKLIKDFFESGKCTQSLKNGDDYFPIEFANLLCVSRNMGKDFLLNNQQISSVFNIDSLKKNTPEFNLQEENSDYFTIISLLYYMGDESEYFSLKQQITKLISKRLLSLNNANKDAKTCFLLLDSISCPFLNEIDRKKWSKRLFKVIYKKEASHIENDSFFKYISEKIWFVSWNYADLWNTLEKKELLFEY